MSFNHKKLLVWNVSKRVRWPCNKLEQFELKLEKIIGVQESAEKLEKYIVTIELDSILNGVCTIIVWCHGKTFWALQ